MNSITEFDLRSAALAFLSGLALCAIAWGGAHPVAALILEYAR